MILKSYLAEGPGKTTTQSFATDTEILLTYTAGLAGMPSGPGASAALYLYDTSGEPMTSGTGSVVCAPCLIESGNGGSTPRRVSVLVEDLITAHGGFGTSNQVRPGFMVLDVPNEADHLAAEVRIRTTHGTAGQPTVVPIQPRDVLETLFETGDVPSLFVLPKVDGISDWNVRDWAIVNATYLGGVGTAPAGAGASLEVYLFNDDGSPTGGLTSPVCAPCTYALGNGGTTGAPRNVALRFPPTPTTSGDGFAVFRVAGADPSAVVLERTNVDSIPGAIPTLLVTGSHLMAPLVTPTTVTGIDQPDIPGIVTALRGSPNPAGGEMRFVFDLARATSIELAVFDATGRHVATVDTGLRPPGHHELRWDRRDAAGRALAAGVYYGRLRAGDGSRITRLVFLPE